MAIKNLGKGIKDSFQGAADKVSITSVSTAAGYLCTRLLLLIDITSQCCYSS